MINLTASNRINKLAKINNAKEYLEIGVARGVTFNNVQIVNKTGVDPKFKFDISTKNAGTQFYQMISDEYFSKHAKNKIFDVIYIDGLHTFEQTFRDFCASLSVSNKNTIWLIDDTHPKNEFQIIEPQIRKQDNIGVGISGWTGDVFKIVVAIHDFFPQFSYKSFEGRGQIVLWYSPRKDFKPVFNSLEQISKLTYDDFCKLKNTVFRTSKNIDIFNEIKSTLTFDDLKSSFCLKSIIGKMFNLKSKS